MNLTKLFEMQVQLDADIMANHPVQEGEDRFGKKVLALLVELGELGQEWRGFKYWSKDQQARTTKQCPQCNTDGERYDTLFKEYLTCASCNGEGSIGNPMLEEYVDCLHFILSIGNDWDVMGHYADFKLEKVNPSDVQKNLFYVFSNVTALPAASIFGKEVDAYGALLGDFLELGDALGFTGEQIEQAYYDKNKENFARQARGY